MATNYIAPTWRMPENSNQSKLSNYSINFDGSSDYIDLGSDVLFDSNKSFSFSAWVNLDAYSPLYPGVVLLKTDQSVGFSMFLSETAGYEGINIGSASSFIQAKTTGDISGEFIGAWKHVCFTFDGVDRTAISSYKIYVDGSSITLTTSSTFAAHSNVNYLGLTATVNTYWNGKLSQLSIFDYELSEDQITYLYNLNNPMAITGAKPIAYYSLGDNSNPARAQGYPNLSVGGSVFNFIPNDHIDLGNNSNLSPTSQLSVSAWVKDTGTGVGIFPTIIGNVSPSSNNGGWILAKYQNKWRFYLDTTGSSGWAVAESNGTVVINSWQHLCATWDGSTVILYLNGQAQTTTASASQIVYNADTETVIGEYRAGTDYFGGEMSNIALLDTALTPTQVTTLYNNGAPGDISSLNPTAWYKLDSSEIYNNTSTQWSVDNNAYPSVYKSSLDFDGANSRITFGNVNGFDITDEFSVSCWVNLSSLGTQYFISKQQNSGNYRGYIFSLKSDNTLQFALMQTYNSKQILVSSSETLSANVWYNLVFTYDGSNNGSGVKMYINGTTTTNTVSSLGTITTILNTSGFQISGRGGSSGNIDGQLSNVAVFNTGLSQSQVTTLYNNGTPEASISHSPVSWWKLDNTTTGLIDNGSASNNGTNNGATEYAGFVNALAGESVNMDSFDLVQSDLYRQTPYSDYSIKFNGGTQYFSDGATSGIFNGATSLSISGWMNIDSGETTSIMIGSWKTGGTQFLIRWRVAASNSFEFYLNTGINTRHADTSGFTASYNTWYHVVGTWDGSNMGMYLNGVAYPTAAAPGALNSVSQDNWIGKYSGTYMDGNLSNIACWKNTALTQSEITEIYNAGVPTDLSTFSGTAPTHWYPMDQRATYFNGSTLTIRDTINNNDMLGYNYIQGASAIEGNAPGSSANGTGANIDITDLKGDMSGSTKNLYSINMADYGDPNSQGVTPADSGRTTSVPG